MLKRLALLGHAPSLSLSVECAQTPRSPRTSSGHVTLSRATRTRARVIRASREGALFDPDLLVRETTPPSSFTEGPNQEPEPWAWREPNQEQEPGPGPGAASFRVLTA